MHTNVEKLLAVSIAEVIKEVLSIALKQKLTGSAALCFLKINVVSKVKVVSTIAHLILM